MIAALALAALSPIQIQKMPDMTVVRVDLGQAHVKLGLAKGKIGQVEDLASIAKRSKALAAINGSFFEAYTDRAIKNPEQSLIGNGRLIHKGSTGSMIGFTLGGEVRIGQPRWRIDGSRNGSSKWPNNWFAYWVNRFPTGKTVTIFTPDWGTSTGMTSGTGVVVEESSPNRSGQVVSIGGGDQRIPIAGYVIHFQDAEPSLLRTFKVGQKISYTETLTDGDTAFWSRVVEGVGAGPQLVRGGRVEPDPLMEGFRDPKIMSGSGARSAVGIKGNTLFLVTTQGTIQQIAQKMKKLGCEDAMNLDGGASSCLWANGSYLRSPGRQISNALLILPGK